MTDDVVLRDVTERDLPIFFEHQCDPEANRTAAFAARDLDAFLGEVTSRPLYGYVAAHNAASIRVLEKCGFTISDELLESSDEPDDRVAGVTLKLEAEVVLRLDAEEPSRPRRFGACRVRSAETVKTLTARTWWAYPASTDTDCPDISPEERLSNSTGER